MSKSQISFFNNTGIQTWELVNVSEKYYEMKSFGEEPIYLNIEKNVVESEKLESFVTNYTNMKSVVSAFNERGVTTYMNNDLIPTITKGKDQSDKVFTGNILLLSLDITDKELARVITDRGSSIIDHQIIEVNKQRILNVLVYYKERDKTEDRMTITVMNETGKELIEYSFRFKGNRMLHLYKNIITRKKPYIINEKDIRLKKPYPKFMSYNIVTTKGQMESLKRINKSISKIILVKNAKDAKYLANQKLKTVTIYDPKGELQQNVIDMIVKNVGNVYMFEETNSKMHKL